MSTGDGRTVVVGIAVVVGRAVVVVGRVVDVSSGSDGAVVGGTVVVRTVVGVGAGGELVVDSASAGRAVVADATEVVERTVELVVASATPAADCVEAFAGVSVSLARTSSAGSVSGSSADVGDASVVETEAGSDVLDELGDASKATVSSSTPGLSG